MRVTKNYVFFWGSEFSNWFPSEFQLEGKKFYNAEQYFMYKKAQFFNDEEMATAILCTDDPKVAKKLGRKVKNFDADVWLKVCKGYMKYDANVSVSNIFCPICLIANLISFLVNANLSSLSVIVPIKLPLHL